MTAVNLRPVCYLFLDESGEFNFTPTGPRYFVVSALTATRPFAWEADLAALRFDLIEQNLDLEEFHAVSDRPTTRSLVFDTLSRHADSFRLYSVIVEMRKTVPALQDKVKFYSRVLGYLLRFVIEYKIPKGSQIIIITDSIPDRGKRRAIEKAIKMTLARMLPLGCQYTVSHHDSKCCPSLQAVDYCNWAVYRKWRDGDTKFYAKIAPAVKSEFDIFQSGRVYYY